MSFITSGLIGANPGAAQPAADLAAGRGHALGTLAHGDNGSAWIYVKAAGAIAQYDYVCIDEDFNALAGTKTNVDAGHTLGVAQAALASGEYGWAALAGRGGIQVNVLANCTADSVLYTSGTAGKLDDDSTSQTAIAGIVIVAANGGSTAAVECIATYPRGK